MSNTLKHYIASQLRIHRRAAGMNQADLATRVERSTEAISNIETGRSLPAIDTLVALADALGVDIADFLPEDDTRAAVSVNRLKREAEAMTLLRGLSDQRLDTAPVQMRALAEMK